MLMHFFNWSLEPKIRELFFLWNSYNWSFSSLCVIKNHAEILNIFQLATYWRRALGVAENCITTKTFTKYFNFIVSLYNWWTHRREGKQWGKNEGKTSGATVETMETKNGNGTIYLGLEFGKEWIFFLLQIFNIPAIQGISINIADVKYTHSNSSRLMCMWNGTWNPEKTAKMWVTGIKSPLALNGG